MSVRGPLPGLLLVFTAGCAHTVPCPTVASVEPAVAPASPAQLAPPRKHALHDVSWLLRSDDGASWSDAPSTLHTFSVGRWECALGEVLSEDALAAAAVDVRRTRRLACTHATGATVQTSLTCTLHSEREPASKPAAPPPSPRELPLQLDSAPAVQLRCAPVEVQELALVSRDGRPIAVLCARPDGIDECKRAEDIQATHTNVAPAPQ